MLILRGISFTALYRLLNNSLQTRFSLETLYVLYRTDEIHSCKRIFVASLGNTGYRCMAYVTDNQCLLQFYIDGLYTCTDINRGLYKYTSSIILSLISIIYKVGKPYTVSFVKEVIQIQIIFKAP